jgi:hypothetical protein
MQADAESDMKTRMPIAALLVIAAVSVGAQNTPADPALFSGLDGCFALSRSQQLQAGDQLIVLAADREPEDASVDAVRSRAESPDCARRFQHLQPDGFAQVTVSEELRHDVLFALQDRPGLRVIGGTPAHLSRKETDRLARLASASLPAVWRSKNVLVQALAFGDGERIIELYLGLPEPNRRGSSAPIRSIQIRRFFLVGDQIRASEEYERASGREERVDTEAPILTVDNWWNSKTERTVGFISEDEGGLWTRLSTNVGFEGIWWIAESLRPGLPRTSELFLYTSH